MYHLAVAMNLSWGIIGTIAAALTAGGAGAGWVIWQGKKAWDKLNKNQADETAKREAEDKARQEKLAKEDAIVRESLLTRYKEMYELEKERSDRELSDMNKRIESLRKEQGELQDRYIRLREDYNNLQEEHAKVVSLNIRYQGDNETLRTRLSELEQQIKNLENRKKTTN